jgi:Zn-dependent peptidase ImmA (M78 family)
MVKQNRKKTWRSAAAQSLLELAGGAGTVESAVASLAEGYLQGTTRPPTDLDQIAPKLGITGFEAAEIAGSGELRRDGDRLRVFYSIDLSADRRRFTIAHEMGHALLESTGPKRPQKGKEVERLCDMFAAELLMPRQEFLDRAHGEASTERILELARHFRTSLTTTGIRYAELLGVSVFAYQDERVIWGKDAFRRAAQNSIDDSFLPAIRRALEGETSFDEFFLSSDTSYRRWRFECRPLNVGRSVLCLLQPATAKR